VLPYLLASISFLLLCWVGPLAPTLGIVARVTNSWSRLVLLVAAPMFGVFGLYFFAHFVFRVV
jgi:hypothetical protein